MGLRIECAPRLVFTSIRRFASDRLWKAQAALGQGFSVVTARHQRSPQSQKSIKRTGPTVRDSLSYGPGLGNRF
jgi:hypothetical protein